MKKSTIPTTADLTACVIELSPTGQEFFFALRDRDWFVTNANTAGLKRPEVKPITALLSSEFFSRDQMRAIVERTVQSRDRAWRAWVSDPLAQAQFVDGPVPIHLMTEINK